VAGDGVRKPAAGIGDSDPGELAAAGVVPMPASAPDEGTTGDGDEGGMCRAGKEPVAA